MPPLPDHPTLRTDTPAHVALTPWTSRLLEHFHSLKLAAIAGLFGAVISWLFIALPHQPGVPLSDWRRAAVALVGLAIAEAVWIALARRYPTRIRIEGSRVWFGRRFFGAWYDAETICLIDDDQPDLALVPRLRTITVTFAGRTTRRTTRHITLRPDDAETVVTLLRSQSSRAALVSDGSLIALPEDVEHAGNVKTILDRRAGREVMLFAGLGLLFTLGGIGMIIEACVASPPAPNRTWDLFRNSSITLLGVAVLAFAWWVRRSHRAGTDPHFIAHPDPPPPPDAPRR